MNPETIVQKQVEAYNSRDIEKFLACHDANIKLYNFAETTPYATGHSALKQIYGEVFNTSPNLNAKIMNRIVMGNTVIDHELVTGRKGIDLEIIAIYEVENDLIVEARFKRKV